MKRNGEINMTRAIIAEELERFKEFYETLNIRPIICSITQKAERIRTCQLEATLKNINASLSEDDFYKIDAMTKAIVNRILQEPIVSLKENSFNPVYANVAADLFKINEGKQN
jgi:glutamyl-tRNA reductase